MSSKNNINVGHYKTKDPWASGRSSREGRIQTITQSATKSKTSGPVSKTTIGKENKPASREANAKQKRYATGIALAFTVLLSITEQVNCTKEL